MDVSFLEIKCTKCGSAAEYDIIKEFYKCKACGNTFKAVDPVNNFNSWRETQKESTKQELRKLAFSICQCSSCGARFFFKSDVFTSQCPYCNASMVRKEFQESDTLPELIIPFILTKDEAKERLLEWIENNKTKKEAKVAKDNIKKLEGYYLPYCLIKGPLDYKVNLGDLNVNYDCRVFVKQNVINASKELDNTVLDAMEPFDWNKAIPFDFGTIAGQSVKIRNIDANELIKRAIDEVTDNVRPNMARQIGYNDLYIKCSNSRKLLISPILLPAYVYKVNNILVSVNGQTGRVAVTSLKPTIRITGYHAWLVMFIIAGSNIFSSLLTDFSFSGLIIGIFSFFIIYRKAHLDHLFMELPNNFKINRFNIPFSSCKCKAERDKRNGKLNYKYGNDILDDAWPKPVFIQNGTSVLFKIDSTNLATIYCLIFLCLPFLSMLLGLFLLFITKLEVLSVKSLNDLLKISLGSMIFSCLGMVIVFLGYRERYARAVCKVKKINNETHLVYRNRRATATFIILAFVPIFLSWIMFESVFDSYKKELKDRNNIKQREIQDAEKRTFELPTLKQNYSRFVYMNGSSKEIQLYFSDKIEYRAVVYDNNDKIFRIKGKRNKEFKDKYIYEFELLKRGYKLDFTIPKEKICLSKNNDGFSLFKLSNKEDLLKLDNNLEWIVKKDDNTVVFENGDKELKYKIIRKDLNGKDCYVLTNKDEKVLGISYYNIQKKTLEVFKILPKGKTQKMFYSNSVKKASNGDNLLAFPVVLLIEDIDIISRYTMMIELSQLE